MSYILDALKKAGQQRPPGPVPDLFTAQGPQLPTPHRRLAPALVAAVVLGCLAIVGVGAWLGGRNSREDARPSPASPAAPPAAARDERAAPTLPVAAAPVPQRSASAAAKRQRPSSRRASPRAVSSAGAPVPPPPPPSPVLAAEAPPAAPPPAPAPAPASPPVVAAPAPLAAAATPPAAVAEGAETGEVVDAAAAENLAAANAAAESAAAELPPPDGRVVEFAELPAAIRGGLPALAITGHVWSDEAALRLLTVQDRIVREGGEAGPGVRLEAITPTGAVFVHRGWRFRLPGY